MKNVLIFAAVCLIGVGVYFGFIHKPPGERAGAEVEIIPGIKVKFTRSEDAGEYYGPMLRSFIGRSSGDKSPRSLTEDERRWFMLGTTCRECDLYPGQFAHVMPESYGQPECRAARGIAELAGYAARELWRQGRDKKAADLINRIAVLGWHLARENETLITKAAALTIQAIAYDEFARFYWQRGEKKRVDRYRAYFKTAKGAAADLPRKATRVEALSDFRKMKGIALTHADPAWRKMGCLLLGDPFVQSNPELRADALKVLRTVSQTDADPVVRQYAAAWIPYVDGTMDRLHDVKGIR